jgi:hypothetical protein
VISMVEFAGAATACCLGYIMVPTIPPPSSNAPYSIRVIAQRVQRELGCVVIGFPGLEPGSGEQADGEQVRVHGHTLCWSALVRRGLAESERAYL